MVNDPYQVLGISSSATEEEIKMAYRQLAKKYHPDINPGSKTAEKKMEEINEAYSIVMKMKKDGTQQHYSQSYSGQQNTSGQQYNPFGGGGYQWETWDPFSGFGGNTQTHSQQTYDNPELQAASDYIVMGRYSQALQMLERIPNHSASWHALNARANMGVGNRIAALQSARQAAAMEPDNYEYQQLVQQLSYSSNAYESRGQQYGFPQSLCNDPCTMCCATNLLCSCLSGGRCRMCCC